MFAKHLTKRQPKASKKTPAERRKPEKPALAQRQLMQGRRA